MCVTIGSMTAAALAAHVRPPRARPFDPSQLSLQPFPAESIPLLWEWMHEYPKANLDDYGPRTLEEFRMYLLGRAQAGTKTLGVKVDGEFVGAIAVLQLDRIAFFRGICFAKAVHGKGVAPHAVGLVLQAHWEEGFRKVGAEFMADNRRVRDFLEKLGAVDEGYFKAETMRGGRPVDVRRVAFFAPKKGVIV